MIGGGDRVKADADCMKGLNGAFRCFELTSVLPCHCGLRENNFVLAVVIILEACTGMLYVHPDGMHLLLLALVNLFLV